MTTQNLDMTGKICIVTGATNGIGQVCALTFAERGAELFLVCRDRNRGERTAKRILDQTGNDRVTLLIGNLSSLTDVRQLANSFLQYNKPLHILLNNAGIVNLNRNITEDGFEEMFAVNHLSHFLLTNLLLDRMKSSAPARIVNVASGAHMLVKGINFEDINYIKNFSSLKVYGHSKLANILFTKELASQLRDSGVTANSVHPGEVATGLGSQNGWTGRMINLLMKIFLSSPRKGAQTSVYACTAPELERLSGLYLDSCRERQPKPCALDEVAAKRLWKISSKLVEFPR